MTQQRLAGRPCPVFVCGLGLIDSSTHRPNPTLPNPPHTATTTSRSSPTPSWAAPSATYYPAPSPRASARPRGCLQVFEFTYGTESGAGRTQRAVEAVDSFASTLTLITATITPTKQQSRASRPCPPSWAPSPPRGSPRRSSSRSPCPTPRARRPPGPSSSAAARSCRYVYVSQRMASRFDSRASDRIDTKRNEAKTNTQNQSPPPTTNPLILTPTTHTQTNSSRSAWRAGSAASCSTPRWTMARP